MQRVDAAGLARKVVRIEPLICVKGSMLKIGLDL
jgi:hypothetical protein